MPVAGSGRLAPPDIGTRLISAVRQIPARVRNRRFWEIQGLVAIATAAHYTVEVAGYSIPEGDVHQVALSLYMVPLLYAALSFGWEGTLMTGLWGALLTSPSIWIWHHSQLSWLAELVELGIIMVVGVLVAWRVDRESKQRRIAERTSAGLGLINSVGEALSHTLDVEQRLPEVLRRVREALSVETVAAWLEVETTDRPPILITEGKGVPNSDAYVAAFQLALRSGEATRFVDRTAIAVLRAERGPLGFVAAPTTMSRLKRNTRPRRPIMAPVMATS